MVQRPHPIHFDGRKFTFDTFSREHMHIVPEMKGLIEESIILYSIPRENAPVWSFDTIYVHTYTPKVPNH